MSDMRKICLLGFGEVGSLLADSLGKAKSIEISAFDINFSNNGSRAHSNLSCRPEITAARDAAEAASGADLIISAVTAGQSLAAARSILPGMTAACWFLDLNSVSPRTKIDAAEAVNAAGGRYIEASIMSSIHPLGLDSPVLLGGKFARDFEPVARSIGFSGCRFYRQEAGSTAATKMCRSVIIKGLESLIFESLLAARHYGVEEEVMSSLQNMMPDINWNDHALYMVSRSLEHGVRRSEEMREVYRTIADAGLPARMSMACADSQQWAAGYQEAMPVVKAAGVTGKVPLALVLDNILASVNKRRNPRQEIQIYDY